MDLRTLGMAHALTLGRFTYSKAAKPLANQCHARWLAIVFVLEGSQYYIIDGEGVVIHGGQALRLLPGENFGTGAWPEQRGDVAWIILEAEPHSGPWLGMTPDAAAEAMRILTSPGQPRVFPFCGTTAGLIRSILGDVGDPESAPAIGKSPLSDELIRHQVSTLILLAARQSAGGRQAGLRVSASVRNTVSWLDSHFNSIPQVADLVNRSGLPPSRFHQEFRSLTGCSPRDYILRSRMVEAAKRLSGDGSLSITTLAHALGFSSSQYFATVFRRYFGTTPGDWRQQPAEPPTSRSPR